MRVLFASLASVRHTYPLSPLAIAVRDAGHDVHFAAGENVHAPLRSNGLRPFPPADSFYEIYAEDLEPKLARLRPDLVVHEWGLPGAAIAAHRAGIPAFGTGSAACSPQESDSSYHADHRRPHSPIAAARRLSRPARP